MMLATISADTGGFGVDWASLSYEEKAAGS
jgi:hypothetical protein